MTLTTIFDDSTPIKVEVKDHESVKEQTIEQKYQLESVQTTVSEYQSVRTWALANGYSEMNEGVGTGLQPITMVTWFDAILYCNAKSEQMRLTPCYTVSGSTMRSPGFPVCDDSADGYRLPFEKEWRYGAKEIVRNCENANILCQDPQCKYCKEPITEEDGNYEREKQPSVVGQRAPNEVGLYDVLGNVLEWCFDMWDSNPQYRGVRGAACCFSDLKMEVSDWQCCNAIFQLPNLGFRICKSFAGTLIEERGIR